MIVVNCALKQPEVIQSVEAIEIEGEKAFKFKKKEGIKLYFESFVEENENAVKLIKNTIKSSTYGKALYFNVVAE